MVPVPLNVPFTNVKFPVIVSVTPAAIFSVPDESVTFFSVCAVVTDKVPPRISTVLVEGKVAPPVWLNAKIPPFTCVNPVYVFGPVRVSVPIPDLMKVPVPEIYPSELPVVLLPKVVLVLWLSVRVHPFKVSICVSPSVFTQLVAMEETVCEVLFNISYVLKPA